MGSRLLRLLGSSRSQLILTPALRGDPACRAGVDCGSASKAAVPPGVIAFEHIGKLRPAQVGNRNRLARRALMASLFQFSHPMDAGCVKRSYRKIVVCLE